VAQLRKELAHARELAHAHAQPPQPQPSPQEQPPPPPQQQQQPPPQPGQVEGEEMPGQVEPPSPQQQLSAVAEGEESADADEYGEYDDASYDELEGEELEGEERTAEDEPQPQPQPQPVSSGAPGYGGGLRPTSRPLLRGRTARGDDEAPTPTRTLA